MDKMLFRNKIKILSFIATVLLSCFLYASNSNQNQNTTCTLSMSGDKSIKIEKVSDVRFNSLSESGWVINKYKNTLFFTHEELNIYFFVYNLRHNEQLDHLNVEFIKDSLLSTSLYINKLKQFGFELNIPTVVVSEKDFFSIRAVDNNINVNEVKNLYHVYETSFIQSTQMNYPLVMFEDEALRENNSRELFYLENLLDFEGEYSLIINTIFSKFNFLSDKTVIKFLDTNKGKLNAGMIMQKINEEAEVPDELAGLAAGDDANLYLYLNRADLSHEISHIVVESILMPLIIEGMADYLGYSLFSVPTHYQLTPYAFLENYESQTSFYPLRSLADPGVYSADYMFESIWNNYHDNSQMISNWFYQLENIFSSNSIPLELLRYWANDFYFDSEENKFPVILLDESDYLGASVPSFFMIMKFKGKQEHLMAMITQLEAFFYFSFKWIKKNHYNEFKIYKNELLSSFNKINIQSERVQNLFSD